MLPPLATEETTAMNRFSLLPVSFLLVCHSAAGAVDMDEILAAEYAGIAAAMCPSASTGGGAGAAMDDYEAHRVEPFQAFDNLYYVGMDNISAWALTTSEGIILFEAMMVANWEQTVVDGLEVIEEYAYHDGSTGWSVAISCTSSLMASYLRDSWQRQAYILPSSPIW